MVKKKQTSSNQSKLVLVSHKLPITIDKNEKGLTVKRSAGGLATGVSSLEMSKNSLWIGYAGLPSDELSPLERRELNELLHSKYDCLNVPLSSEDFELYYNGFSNHTLWPLFHYFQVYTSYSQETWEGYCEVNQKFAKVILKHASANDTIWIHDYQLMLVPGMIRKVWPKAKIGFFLHIPFPSYELFRLLPCRKEILEGVLGADLLGFHTWSYARHFLSSVLRLCGTENVFGHIEWAGRFIQADVFPMGIEPERFAVTDHKKSKLADKLLDSTFGDLKLVLSIDRLDYTKGILQRLEAWERFLENAPHWHGKTSLLVLAVPTRTKILLYQQLKDELERTVGRINGRFSTIEWQPIHYFYRTFDFPALRALYQRADLALVTPLRDGMNLVAKEFIAAHANKQDGVLVLSETAGAAEELGEALLVNPNDIDEVAKAIEHGLTMPVEEQAERISIMQKRVFRSTVAKWASDFIERLVTIHSEEEPARARPLTKRLEKKMLTEYKDSASRLFLLDYDGTLIGLQKRPELAKPDRSLLSLLEGLAKDPANEVVIISGRMQKTLEDWFGQLDLTLIGEHGSWIRRAGQAWDLIVHDDFSWKEGVQAVLERFTDSTPGSFIEAKTQALTWHYRNVDPDLVPYRLQELRLHLRSALANLPVGVLDGNKVLEVRNLEANKSRATQLVLESSSSDFIFSAGDDLTDEEMFAVLPKQAWSLHVGGMLTKARSSVNSWREIRRILKGFLEEV